MMSASSQTSATASAVAWSITPREVEARVLTAIRTLDALSDPDFRYVHGSATIWARVEHIYGDLVGPPDEAKARARLGRFVPTRGDIDDMLPALACIGPESKPWLWLLRARAYERSYRQIVLMRGHSPEYWRFRYRKTLGWLTARANGIEPEKTGR